MQLQYCYIFAQKDDRAAARPDAGYAPEQSLKSVPACGSATEQLDELFLHKSHEYSYFNLNHRIPFVPRALKIWSPFTKET